MPESSNDSPLVQVTDRGSSIGEIVRPTAGWLRSIRERLGLSLTDLAKRLQVTPPAVRSFERAEAEDRITLASLRRTAAAMDCELIYALVPRTGTPPSLAEAKAAARHSPPAAPVTPPESTAEDDPAKKVTDLTWHTLHGES